MLNLIKRKILYAIYKGQYRNGHYYSPIPDINQISKYEDMIFHDQDIGGIDLNTDSQVDLLNRFTSYINEFDFSDEKQQGYRYYKNNGFFNASDGFSLYAMMRDTKPKRIIEIGSGHSSALMLDVNSKYFNDSIELNFIEPNPERLYNLINKESEACSVLEKEVQSINLDFFKQLEENDILFIDSSHVSKAGSDVNHLIFNVLPVLQSGVHVHFHDILYPFEYPKEWIYSGIYWNEAYLLRAFLMHNSNYEISFFVNLLNKFHSDKIESSIFKVQGGSIWLRKK